MKGSLLKILVFTTMLILTLQPVLAQNRPPIVPGDVDNLILPHPEQEGIPAEQYFGGVLLAGATRNIITMAGAFAFLYIIIGGIQILTAYGNEEKISKAKKTITYAIVGLLIAILSYSIVSIISSVRLGTTTQQQLAPGSEDMTPEEMKDPGKYGPGSEPIQGGIKPQQ